MECSIDGCVKRAAGRGWCHAHYKKWQLHGNPEHGRSYARPRGAGTITGAGYIAVMVDGKKRQQHIQVAESILGKPLPIGAIVHHVNHDRANNYPGNLVICPDQAYHLLIHMREKAMDACGNPNFRRCVFCKEYDDPSSMTKTGGKTGGHRHYHKVCRTKAEYDRTHK